ncbi:MAG: hypothetical protein ACI85O_002224, partial [Saprospiraceae bacterium]
AEDALRAINEIEDKEFKDKYKALLEPFIPRATENRRLPGS